MSKHFTKEKLFGISKKFKEITIPGYEETVLVKSPSAAEAFSFRPLANKQLSEEEQLELIFTLISTFVVNSDGSKMFTASEVKELDVSLVNALVEGITSFLNPTVENIEEKRVELLNDPLEGLSASMP